MTAHPGHPLDGVVISSDEPCSQCGYNLKGLARGSVCPECGTPIRSSRKRFADNLTDAPLWFLRRLAWGSGMLAVSMLLLITLIGMTVGVGSASLFTALAGGSLAGIFPKGLGMLALVTALVLPVFCPLGFFLVATRRPHIDGMTRDAVLDRPHLRRVVQVVGVLVPLAIVSFVASGFAGGPIAVGLVVTGGLFVLAIIVATVPSSIYLASLSDWAGDTNLGGRFRACAWGVSVFGFFSTICVGMGVMPVGFAGLASFGAFWMLLFLGISLAVLMISIIQLANVCRWAVANSVTRAERDQRLAEKRRRAAEEMVARSTGGPAPVYEDDYDPADDPTCVSCGYSLGGLPQAGRCPECATPYLLAPGDLIQAPRRAVPLPTDDERPIALSDLERPGAAGESPPGESQPGDLPPGYAALGPDPESVPGGEQQAPASVPARITHTPRSISAPRRGRREDSSDTGRGDKPLDSDGWSV